MNGKPHLRGKFHLLFGESDPLSREIPPFSGKTGPTLWDRCRSGGEGRAVWRRLPRWRKSPCQREPRWLSEPEIHGDRRLFPEKSYPIRNILSLDSDSYSNFRPASIIPGSGETRNPKNPCPAAGGILPRRPAHTPHSHPGIPLRLPSPVPPGPLCQGRRKNGSHRQSFWESNFSTVG